MNTYPKTIDRYTTNGAADRGFQFYRIDVENHSATCSVCGAIAVSGVHTHERHIADVCEQHNNIDARAELVRAARK